MSGTFVPSLELLSEEAHWDANWLRGLPTFVFSLVPNNWGLVLARLIMPGLALSLLLNLFPPKRPGEYSLLLIGWLLAVCSMLQPVAAGFEVLLVIVAARLLTADSGSRLLPWSILCLVWANFSGLASLPLVMPLLFTAGSRKQTGILTAIAAGAIVCTPRGLLTWLDAAATICPIAFVDRWVIDELGLGHPLPLAVTPEGAGLLLVVLFAIRWLSLEKGVILGGLLALSMANVELIPVTATVSTITVLNTQQHSPKKEETGQRSLSQTIGAAVCAVLAFVSFLGLWPNNSMRLAVGIDLEISPSEYSELLPATSSTGTIFSTDRLASSTASLITSPTLKLQDYPMRAVIGGRAEEWATAARSLRLRIREEQPFNNGVAIGWYPWLNARETRLLAITSSKTQLIEALNEEAWKPLGVSTPVLLFGKAGDPQLTPQILEILELTTFLNYGPWNFELTPPSLIDEPLDVEGLVTGQASSGPFRQQIQVFMAFDAKFAAARMLHQCSNGNGNYDTSWKELTHRFAFEEFLNAGRASLFRTQLAVEWNELNTDAWSRFGWSGPPEFTDDSRWRDAIDCYLREELQQANEKLNFEHPEAIYAQAMIAMEQGDTASTVRHLQRLVAQFPDHPNSELAELLQERVVD